MSFKVSVLGLACLLVAVLATSAEAQRSYPLTGNARFQIGDGLPIPIGFTGPPNGKVKAIDGARITQTSGPDPKQITFGAPGQLYHPGGAINLPVFVFNSKVFQVLTNITIGFPAPSTAPNLMTATGNNQTWQEGGRTGAAVVTFCPGNAVTPIGNPNCSTGNPTNVPGQAAGRAIDGFLKYTATANQFGGPMRGDGGGTADVAGAAGVPAGGLPCDSALPTGPNGKPCIVAFALATPAGTGILGGAFGIAASSPGSIPAAPGGRRNAKVAANGEVLSVTSPGIGSGVGNAATTFGGPWTTGMLTVNQSAAVASPEVFTITGSDNRVNGIGTLSLVSGSLTDRAFSDPNANRGWVNLVIGGDTPALSSWGVGFLAMLLAGAGAWRARRAMAG